VTQVDFYILRGGPADARLRTACRLAEKAMQLDQQVFIRSSTEGEARQLDELLWTFSESSFVPHRVVPPGAGAAAAEADASLEPVLVGVEEGPVRGRWDLLINLGEDVPAAGGRYARIAEIVDADPGRRQRGRERYKHYRDEGYKLVTHEL
jgi:DNA polymerase-3 subunit chi